METRIDKLTKRPVSLLGFGTMRLPTREPDGKIDTARAQEMIDYAYAHGVNYYDTAYPYHGGESERFIGAALQKYPRDSFFLADKMPPWHLRAPGDAQRIFEEQLGKCQVDYFDYYLCHNLTAELVKPFQQFDVISYLDGEKKAGRIRHLGFSFHDTPEVLERVVELYDWDFAQIQLNYLDWDRQNARRQYEILTEHGIPVIIMEPVRGGTLATLSGDSAALLREREPERSLASWAIRFAASLPNVMTVLSGMSTEEQVEDNIATMSGFRPLTDEERELVFRAAELFCKNVTIPCTGCRYCMECPQGVDIPAIFAAYNEYAVDKSLNGLKRAYEQLGETKQIHRCVRCGQCAPHCPQGIEIPERLAEIDKIISGEA